MRYVVSLVVLLLVCSMVCVVFAAEPDPVEGVQDPAEDPVVDETTDPADPQVIVTPNITVEPAPVEYEVYTEGTTVDLSLTLADQPAAAAAAPALDAPEPADGFVQAVSAIIGTYNPRTETVTVTAEDGSVHTYQQIVPGLAGMDWPWIFSALLFAVVVYSFLRCVGVLLRG